MLIKAVLEDCLEEKRDIRKGFSEVLGYEIMTKSTKKHVKK